MTNQPNITTEKSKIPAALGSPWGVSPESVIDALQSSPDGLSDCEVKKRIQEYGLNCIVEMPPVSLWKLWLRQFRSLIVALLIAAACTSAFIGDWMEALAVVAVIFVNALIGFFIELKANRSMEALKKLSHSNVRVRREGVSRIVPSEELVPGDWVILEAGDIVPADLRAIEVNLLQSDESSLTGESIPIRKQIESVEEETLLAERRSMLYQGAKITGGNGAGVVTSTGESSELGKISKMVSQADRHSTPLEKQLDRLGYCLIWVTLLLATITAVAGILKGLDTMTMIQTAIALAVAAIPEGLPVVATIALAHGLWRMSEKDALLSQLSAVETLGSTGVICTDKTGTLTENKMTATVIWPVGSNESLNISPDCSSNVIVNSTLMAGLLCNNAELSKKGGKPVGDPLEVALLEAAELANFDIENVRHHFQRIREVPFDAQSRIMSTVQQTGTEFLVSVKGALEAVVPLCITFGDYPDSQDNEQRKLWEERNRILAEKGYRVIALAEKHTDEAETNPLGQLSFLGLIGLIDPPRPDVTGAVRECLEAGIRIVMITGDQAPTAEAVAKQIGIESEGALTGTELDSIDLDAPETAAKFSRINVIARATPAQKLKLVKHFQNSGQIVAMTGDGVNDAPALKQADIGIAMGVRGTDVAREASAMVLRDDAFPSIVAAIEQGRTIFTNIRKFAYYLISCNISEILVVWLATALTETLPILPLQILFLNLVTDVFPALALGVTPSRTNLMTEGPRKRDESVLRKSDWIRASWHAFTIAGATLGAFLFAINILGQTSSDAITISFLTLAVAQLLHVFNMAGKEAPYFRSEIVCNPMVWAALGLCLFLLALACYQPVLAQVLNLRQPTLIDCVTLFGFAAIPVVIEIIWRRLRPIVAH